MLATLVSLVACSKLAGAPAGSHALDQLLLQVWQEHHQGPLRSLAQQLPSFAAADFNAAADAHAALLQHASHALQQYQQQPQHTSNTLPGYQVQQSHQQQDLWQSNHQHHQHDRIQNHQCYQPQQHQQQPQQMHQQILPTPQLLRQHTALQQHRDQNAHDQAFLCEPSGAAQVQQSHLQPDTTNQPFLGGSTYIMEGLLQAGAGNEVRSSDDNDRGRGISRGRDRSRDRSRSRSNGRHHRRSSSAAGNDQGSKRKHKHSAEQPIRHLEQDITRQGSPDQLPSLPPGTGTSGHKFHAAVMQLPSNSRAQALLKQGLLHLLQLKPAFYCKLDLRVLSALQQLKAEFVLLALCQMCKDDTSNIANPASFLQACCNRIRAGFKLSIDHSVLQDSKVWEMIASGQGDDDAVPPFVTVWVPKDSDSKRQLVVGSEQACLV